MIDQFFEYQFGELEYRSVRFGNILIKMRTKDTLLSQKNSLKNGIDLKKHTTQLMILKIRIYLKNTLEKLEIVIMLSLVED